MQEKSSLDKNTLIGLLLMGAILIGFGWFQGNNKEENPVEPTEQVVENKAEETPALVNSNTTDAVIDSTALDSNLVAEWENTLGAFAAAAADQIEPVQSFSLSNEHLNFEVSTLGAKPVNVVLKNYYTYDSLPLTMVDGDQSFFNLNFWAQGRQIQTAQLKFKPVYQETEQGQTLSMRLQASANAYLALEYHLKSGAKQVDFNIRQVGLESVLSTNALWELNWHINALSQEKSLKSQREKSTLYYRLQDETDYISEMRDGEEDLEKVSWVAYKNQFFATIFKAEKPIEKVKVETINPEEDFTDYVKTMKADYQWNYQGEANTGFSMYFLPNHFKTLKPYKANFEDLVPLGWGIFGWINRFVVIQIFNLLDGFNLGYGLIIFIMAFVIKLALSPLTYKSYVSMARMRVLKPQVDKLSEKYDDQMKKQQATMELYRKAGVNPLGGCLPMLLQFPILIALFRFFPASFELRQESFWWAEDLSTYDSILSLPFTIPFYGDHVSLFTLLMTASTLLYTWMNNQMSASSAQMPQMKVMMYLMPVIFMGVLNSYPAALSYYYFLANMITFGQQFFIRRMIDEDAILAKIEEKKQQPQKKSKFQARMEELARQRQMQGRK